MQPKTWFAIASLSALLAVALGAFGAHALKARLAADLLEIFEVGVRYHMYHALALGLVAVAGWSRPDLSIGVPAALLLAGTVIFSGSLYVLAFTGARWLGAVTPIGGTAFLVGWGWLAVSALRLPSGP